MQNDDDSRSSMRSIKSLNSPASIETPPIMAPVISLNLGANAKKKRLEVKDIFNNDEDSEEINGSKRRKLVPLGKRTYFISFLSSNRIEKLKKKNPLISRL